MPLSNPRARAVLRFSKSPVAVLAAMATMLCWRVLSVSACCARRFPHTANSRRVRDKIVVRINQSVIKLVLMQNYGRYPCPSIHRLQIDIPISTNDEMQSPSFTRSSLRFIASLFDTGAGNRDYPRLLAHHPGKGDLRGRGMFLLCQFIKKGE